MKYLFITIFLVSTLLSVQKTEACEIKFTVLGEAKEGYNAGDEIIIKVEVIFTHWVCPEGIDNTKFKYDGLEILGATKWQEEANGRFVRKLKIKISERDNQDTILEAIRKCDKEGGYSKISFKRANQVK